MLARISCLLVFFGVLGPAAPARADLYDDFNTFCQQNFGALHEPLVYQAYGRELKFLESGFWLHESRNSAAVGFETNLPSKSHIEFGETTSYGRRTSEHDRSYYLHLHHLTGLEPDRTYHYRLVAVDELGQTITAPDKTFQTHAFPDAIPVPGALAGPPYVLNQAGRLYILTQDISSLTRGISLKAKNITLDLNGHTILYDEGAPAVSGAWNDYLYSDTSTSGIHLHPAPAADSSIRIINGAVRQGRNNGRGQISVGFNPILLSGGKVEVAGIAAEWSGHSVGGFENHWGPLNAHHNVLVDRGSGIDNRHQGIKAIYGNSTQDIHHNLVKRARHQVIMAGNGDSDRIFSNEIYQDSYDTNAFGIKPGREVYGNRIFGTGYHVNAISWRSNITVHDNFIHLQGTAPTNRSPEYGAMASVNGIRLTQYAGGTTPYENNLYYNNTIVVKGRQGTTTMRGVQFFSDPYVKNLIFRNNVIKTEVQDTQTTAMASCVNAQGLSDRAGQWLPILYEGNTFITNSVFIRFGDDYGSGGNHHFKNSRFIKFGSHPGYRGFNVGYWTLNNFGNTIIDSVLEGGASLEHPRFEGSGRRDYSVGHGLHIVAKDGSGKRLAGKVLAVFDNTGQTYATATDGEGGAKLDLLEYTLAASGQTTTPGKTLHTGHNLRITGYLPLELPDAALAIRDNGASPLELIFKTDLMPPAAPGRLQSR